MYRKHLTIFIIISLLISTLLTTFSPTTLATLETDDDDGIWTAEFDTGSDQYFTYKNCLYDTETENAVILNTSANIQTYDFNLNSNHQAYGFPTNLVPLYTLPIFKPYRPFKERIFGFDELIEIETINGDDDEGYADRSTEGKISVVQHFRFKIGIKESLIESIQINWVGKALGDAKIELYYYRYITTANFIGGWTYLEQDQSNGQDITITGDIPESDIKNAINNDNILDVYVVATRATSSCTLLTDYVNITTQTKTGYDLGFGLVETITYIEPQTISKVQNFYWEQLIWNDFTNADTEIRYQLLFENASKIPTRIPEEDLPGNIDGFTRSPILLNALDIKKYEKLIIRANLTTSNPTSTPKLFGITITWQTNPNGWKDLFNYDFRIDIRNRLNLDKLNGEGFLNLTLAQGNWPMVGFDSEHTRSSDTKGADTNNVFWYSEVLKDDVRHKMLSPVLRDGTLITTAELSNMLYYSTNIITKPSGLKLSFSTIDFDNDLNIRVPPALSEEYIIVATGEEDITDIVNIVYGLDRENPEDNDKRWTYTYSEPICYGAAPTIDDHQIYLTSYNPFLFHNYSTVLLVLTLDGKFQWDFTLPASSVSSPAVHNEIVVVCCKQRSGKSVFAFHSDGSELWNKSLGEVGKAAPVIYEDMVFITSKSMGSIKVTALTLQNGTELWSKTIGTSAYPADFTPCVYNDILYVALPKGTITALNTNNGDQLWVKDVVTDFGARIAASPSYADGKLFIPLSADSFGIGACIALDTEIQDTQWQFNTLYSPRDNGVLSSPIITNGMVIFGDENGRIYSIGEYVEPDKELDGTLISMPIELPPGAWWNRFYANIQTLPGYNSITFQLLDEDKNFLTNLQNGKAIALGQGATTRIARLRADFTAINITINPRLLSWNLTFTKDETPPEYDLKSFRPGSEGWLNEIVSRFSINVRDEGTGLLINSAEYTLTYDSAAGTKTQKKAAVCTGTNGTTNEQTIIADIGNESFYQNITALKEIIFSIKDLANNLNTTKITFRQDTQTPTSSINNETLKDTYNEASVLIQVTATDPGTTQNASGIAVIELKYRFSNTVDPSFSGSWKSFEQITSTPYQFRFTPKDGGGWYELTTIATDIIGNTESDPSFGDVQFLMDAEPPEKPAIQTDGYWFNTLPQFTLSFTDDFLIDQIEYKPNFETNWITIASEINKKTYNTPWTISSDIWDQMNEGETYYLHLKITDFLGNTQTITSNDDAITFYKDITNPNVALESPTLTTDWTWEDTFDIIAFADDSTGSGIQTLTLEYSYSEDNTTWGDWIPYEDEITSSDITWEFKAEKGNGFYRFRITAIDNAENQAQTQLIIGINIFPLALVAALFILLVILLILTIFFIWWKKNHPVKNM